MAGELFKSFIPLTFCNPHETINAIDGMKLKQRMSKNLTLCIHGNSINGRICYRCSLRSSQIFGIANKFQKILLITFFSLEICIEWVIFTPREPYGFYLWLLKIDSDIFEFRK